MKPSFASLLSIDCSLKKMPGFVRVFFDDGGETDQGVYHVDYMNAELSVVDPRLSIVLHAMSEKAQMILSRVPMAWVRHTLWHWRNPVRIPWADDWVFLCDQINLELAGPGEQGRLMVRGERYFYATEKSIEYVYKTAKYAGNVSSLVADRQFPGLLQRLALLQGLDVPTRDYTKYLFFNEQLALNSELGNNALTSVNFDHYPS